MSWTMYKECHEGVTRNGEYQPCERPAVGYATDEEGGRYPVCRRHVLREDVYTNTEADAARYERERARDAGEDDRPTLADCGDF